MSLLSIEHRWNGHRAFVTQLHADALGFAEGCADPVKARDYHAQVRVLTAVLANLDAADRNGPVEPL